MSLGGLYFGENVAAYFVSPGVAASPTPIGTTSWVLDPALVGSKVEMRLGGRLVGTGSLKLFMYLGGSKFPATDGTLVYTSPDLTAPIAALNLNMGVINLGSGLTRIKFACTSTAGGWQIDNFFVAIQQPPSLPSRPRVARRRPQLLTGVDIDVVTDLPPSFVLAEGLANIGNACARRLDTPAGSLEQIGDDPDYGYDLRGKLNADLSATELAAIPGEVERELRKDERIQAATVTFNYSFADYTAALDCLLTTAAGPYRLILGVGTASVDVLDEGLVRPSG